MTSVSNMRGLPPSGTTFSSMAICSDCGSDVCLIISTGCRGSPIEASWARLLIEGVIGGDLDYVSSHCALYEVRLCFLLFGPSMPAYMPTEPTTLSDVSRSEIRDGIKMGSGGEDRGELGVEERGDDDDE